MVRDKAYVCNACRKVITYSPDQAGSSFPCPFCKSPIKLPVLRVEESRSPGAKALWLPLAALVCVAAGAGFFLWSRGSTTAAPVETPLSAIPAAETNATVAAPAPAAQPPLRPRITVAPAPAQAKGVSALVAVPSVRYGCPQITHAAIRKTRPMETAVCCVDLTITNTGKTPVKFHTWRIFESLSDDLKAKLTDRDGNVYSLVSYGLDSYPAGCTQEASIEPGSTLNETVLFLCDRKPDTDLILALPCENIGGKNSLRFAIPGHMIQ